MVINGYNEYSLNNIEKKISYIKCSGSNSDKIYNPKFPIKLNTKEGMRFISNLYHDGGIGEINRQPQYTNRSFKEVQEFLKDAQRLFGRFNREIKSRISKLSKREYFVINLPTVIGVILISIGYTSGDKTKNNLETFKFLGSIKSNILIREY